MSQVRTLTKLESDLVTALIDAAGPKWRDLKNDLSGATVSEMDDGGMGSLQFTGESGRLFGQNIIEAEFFDKDGVIVSVALYVDRNCRLFELDFWKVDFNKLISLPDVSELRFMPREAD